MPRVSPPPNCYRCGEPGGRYAITDDSRVCKECIEIWYKTGPRVGDFSKRLRAAREFVLAGPMPKRVQINWQEIADA